MTHQEIEVKILEINVEAVVETLKKLGAKEIFSGQIKAEFFKNKDDLRLRLRQVDNQNILTYKRKHVNDQVNHTDEIEVTFDNYSAFKEILTEFGLTQYGSSEKWRTSYLLDTIRYEIDTLPGIPTFVEIEANNIVDMQKGVELLGYTMDQTCTLTERTVKEYYNK